MVIVCSEFERMWAICSWVIDNLANFCPRCVMLWPWPLIPWPRKRVVGRMSCDPTMYQIWARSNNRQLSYWRFSTFLPSNFRGWDTLLTFSGVHGPNFTKLGEDIGQSSPLTKFVSKLRYLAGSPNDGGSKSSEFVYKAKFPTFCFL